MSIVRRVTINTSTGTSSYVDAEQTPEEIAAAAAAVDSASGPVFTGLSIDYGDNGQCSQKSDLASHRAIKMETPTPTGTLKVLVDGIPVELVIATPQDGGSLPSKPKGVGKSTASQRRTP